MNKTLIVIVLILLAAGFFLMFAGGQSEDGDVITDTPAESDQLDPTKSSATSSSQFAMEGTSWDFGSEGRLEFSGGRYSATVGCNTISGDYTLAGSSITFEEGMMTMMACEPDVAEVESELLATLAAIDSFTVADSTITLMGVGAELVLRQPTQLGLVGVDWGIQSIKEGSGIVSAAIDEGTFLTFAEDGSFSGTSACNSVMGNYAVVDNEITFSDVASTKMACPDERMAREQILVETLEKAATFSIERDILSIESSDGEYRIGLRALSSE